MRQSLEKGPASEEVLQGAQELLDKALGALQSRDGVGHAESLDAAASDQCEELLRQVVAMVSTNPEFQTPDAKHFNTAVLQGVQSRLTRLIV